MNVDRRDPLVRSTGGVDRGFIQQIGQLGAAHSCRATSDGFHVDRFIEGLADGVNAQDRAAPVDVRQGHIYLPGEPSGAEDRVV